MKRIESLEEMPRRFPVSLALSAIYKREIRSLLHLDFRVYFDIDEDTKEVRILALRHGNRGEADLK